MEAVGAIPVLVKPSPAVRQIAGALHQVIRWCETQAGL
jgi:hypothetical protein